MAATKSDVLAFASLLDEESWSRKKWVGKQGALLRGKDLGLTEPDISYAVRVLELHYYPDSCLLDVYFSTKPEKPFYESP